MSVKRGGVHLYEKVGGESTMGGGCLFSWGIWLDVGGLNLSLLISWRNKNMDY